MNEFDSRVYDTRMVIKNILTNTTQIFMNPREYEQAMHKNSTAQQYQIIKYPQVNPAEVSGFDVGLW